MIGKVFCSKYTSRKPEDVMTGEKACSFFCPHNNRVMGGILGAAVGDALGVPVEFCTRDELRNNPVKDMRNGGTHSQQAGTWSDDTSLMIASIKALREKRFNIDSMAKKFVEWYRLGKYTARGEVFDIGYSTKKAIERVENGTPAMESGCGDISNNGNGSLMRILPMAFYLKDEQSIDERFIYTRKVSSITHKHLISCIACHIYVEFAIELLANDKFTAYRKLKEKLIDYYNTKQYDYSPFKRILEANIAELSEDDIESSGYVVSTLEAAIWSVMKTNSYREAVLLAVNLGDDTDTVGAVAGGLAGIIYGYDDIPYEWVEVLANKFLLCNAAFELYKKCYERPLPCGA